MTFRISPARAAIVKELVKELPASAVPIHLRLVTHLNQANQESLADALQIVSILRQSPPLSTFASACEHLLKYLIDDPQVAPSLRVVVGSIAVVWAQAGEKELVHRSNVLLAKVQDYEQSVL